jgi:hypothetical protein
MQKSLPLALAVLTACASPAPAPEPVALHQRVSHLVEVFANGREFATGTGQPIGPDLFLTADHVVAPPRYDPFAAMSFQIEGLPVVEVIHLEGLDAALLRTERPHGLEVWPLDARPIVPGEELMLTGWGYGTHRFSRHYGCLEQTCSSGPCAPGDSGGALLDADGDIVAIVVAISTRRFAGHHSHVVPASAIRAQMLAQGITLTPSPPEAL